MQNPFEEINTRLNRLEEILIEIKNIQNPSPISERWFALKDLSEYLPGNPTAATIYSWVYYKKIPHHKIGKKLSFLKSEIDGWLISRKQITKKEIEKAANEFIDKI